MHLFNNTQIFFHLIQVQPQKLGNTLLLHGDTVEHIGGFHGAAAVGNDDELGVFGKAKKIIRIAVNVCFIKCSLDFVQNAERSRLYRKDCKKECNSYKRLLATRIEIDVLKIQEAEMANSLVTSLDKNDEEEVDIYNYYGYEEKGYKEELLDLREELSKLSEFDKKILEKRYNEGLTFPISSTEL